MQSPVATAAQRTQPAGPLELISSCSRVLVSCPSGSSPWSELCRLLVDQVGLRTASLHVRMPHDTHVRCLAHAGEYDECAALAGAVASPAFQLTVTHTRSAKLLVRAAPGADATGAAPTVRKRLFDCLLLPFDWDGVASGILHVHSQNDQPLPPELEAALGLLTDLLSWRARASAPSVDCPSPEVVQSVESNHIPPLDSIIAAIPDVVTRTSADGIVTFVSPSVASVLGYSPDELLGARFVSVVHPEDAVLVERTMRAKGPLRRTVKFRARHAQGHYVSVEASVGRNAGDAGVVAVHREVAASVALAPAVASRNVAAAARPVTVLVVDDEVGIRKVTEAMLQHAGYRVLTAVDGREALRMVEAEDAEIDAVLTDVLMPGMNGPQLVDALDDVRPGIAKLYMSGFSATIRREFDLDPSIPFLEKPFSPEELTRALVGALESSTGNGARVAAR